jgi:hypothetical protein
MKKLLLTRVVLLKKKVFLPAFLVALQLLSQFALPNVQKMQEKLSL